MGPVMNDLEVSHCKHCDKQIIKVSADSQWQHVISGIQACSPFKQQWAEPKEESNE